MLLFLATLLIHLAQSKEELAWGWMDRQSIPDNEAIVFDFGATKNQTLWMFNCYCDLDVAFLDEDGVVVERATLLAYPDKLSRPRHSIQELADISRDEATFFQAHQLTSQRPVRYAVEMKQGTMQANVGDVFVSFESPGCPHQHGLVLP